MVIRTVVLGVILVACAAVGAKTTEEKRRGERRAEQKSSAGRTLPMLHQSPSPRVSCAYLPQGFQKNGRLD